MSDVAERLGVALEGLAAVVGAEHFLAEIETTGATPSCVRKDPVRDALWSSVSIGARLRGRRRHRHEQE